MFEAHGNNFCNTSIKALHFTAVAALKRNYCCCNSTHEAIMTLSFFITEYSMEYSVTEYFKYPATLKKVFTRNVIV